MLFCRPVRPEYRTEAARITQSQATVPEQQVEMVMFTRGGFSRQYAQAADIPRCSIRVPLARLSRRYLARRSTERTVLPVSRLARSSGIGQRSCGWRTTTR